MNDYLRLYQAQATLVPELVASWVQENYEVWRMKKVIAIAKRAVRQVWGNGPITLAALRIAAKRQFAELLQPEDERVYAAALAELIENGKINIINPWISGYNSNYQNIWPVVLAEAVRNNADGNIELWIRQVVSKFGGAMSTALRAPSRFPKAFRA